jgi:hypothetical protein
MLKPQDRYKPNPKFGGRKERQGYVCGPYTWAQTAWCVAVKRDRRGVHVRDTKDMKDTTLSFNRNEWRAFVKSVKAGAFDI